MNSGCFTHALVNIRNAEQVGGGGAVMSLITLVTVSGNNVYGL